VATVVVLNGTSSSGKTSIARAFQEIAPSVFLNFSIDSILLALPASAIARLQASTDIADVGYPRLVQAFYACVRQLADLGHDLVIDHAVISQAEAEMLLAATHSHRIFKVGLDCPLNVLTEREQQRGDRRIGLAAAQFDRIHQWLDYDLMIDTSRHTPEESARRIASLL
jgi:chloramphenicol 3-O phosphotransferase